MLLLLGINSDQNSTIDLRHEPEPNRTNPADVVPSGHGCPEQTEKSGHVSGRSLCPWFVDMNRQRDRIPYLIPQARCKCHRCLNVAVESSLERYTRCEYHYHHMQVLRRLTCKNGFYVYKIHSEAIPVACICVHRKIAMTGWKKMVRNLFLQIFLRSRRITNGKGD